MRWRNKRARFSAPEAAQEVLLLAHGEGPLLRLAGFKGCERRGGDSWALESTAAASGDEEKLSAELFQPATGFSA